MAIDKSNSPRWVKVVVLVVAAGFVLMVVIPMLGTVLTQPSTTSTGQNTGKQSASATETLSALASQYTSSTAEIEKQLSADPKNKELLLAQARQYFDWAVGIGQATQDFAQAQPMAALSVQYYDRAFAVSPGVSGDLVDAAVMSYYSGNVDRAVTLAEGVAKKDPKFRPAFFNLGVFYGAQGRYADAIEAYETAVKLDSKADDVADLQSRIAELKKQSSSATSTP